VLVGVAAAVWTGAFVARWDVLAGALVGAAVSIVASAVAAERGGIDTTLLFGRGAWIGLAELLAVGLLAGWAARALPPLRLSIALVAITAAVIAVGEWRQSGGSNRFVNTSLLIGLAGCVGAGTLLRQSDRDRVVAATRARLDERVAIARELHDIVAHHVTGMVVQAQAGQLVTHSDPERAEASLAAIERAGSAALAAMRRVVGALRTDDGDSPTGPSATLDSLDELASHSAELGLPVRVAIDDSVAVPADVAQAVHRVVRESLTNARRHATAATSVDVRIAQQGSSLDVVVTDDGRVSRTTGTDGFGLVGMAERVEALGGQFVAGPATSGGWEVRATFPLPVAP